MTDDNLFNQELHDLIAESTKKIEESQAEYFKFLKGEREWGDDLLEMKAAAQDSVMVIADKMSIEIETDSGPFSMALDNLEIIEDLDK